MDFSVNTVVFDALAFIRHNAAVFRKYVFLPVILSLASLFLIKIPVAGLGLSAVSNALALSLLGVSASRFYLLGNAEKVADGANRPFARFFFLTFMMTFLGNMSEVFTLLPPSLQGGMFLWMVLGLWINLKTCLAFPALALDHPGSVWDNIVGSFNWTGGLALKIIGSFLICYSPVIFFTLMLMQVPDLMPGENDFLRSLPQLAFSNILIIFSMLWSSLVLAKIYQHVVIDGNKAT